jgi:hypothetical protein
MESGGRATQRFSDPYKVFAGSAGPKKGARCVRAWHINAAPLRADARQINKARPAAMKRQSKGQK